MMKGKPQKKPPRSQAKGKGKRDRDDRKPRDRDAESNSDLNDSIDGKEGNEVDVENHVNDEESRKFARRKIESNWDRYEEPEVDEHAIIDDYDETKDFEYIRQNSASASSHFKFKEEKEWENDLHQAGNKDRSVLGLNLLQLATDLKQYGLEEKLGINHLLPEECKYCVKDLFKNTSNSNQSASCHDELSISSKKIQWSFDGIERYKYLIGLTQENVKMQSVLKPQMNKVANPPNGIINEQKNIHAKKINSKNVLETSSSSVDSHDDIDVLDQLLMSKISINDVDERLDNENKFMEDIEDSELVNHHSNKKQVITDKETISNMNFNMNTKTNNTKSMTVGKSVESEEFDLDMLLESDFLPPVSGSKNIKNVDTDLDQWLDDILT